MGPWVLWGHKLDLMWLGCSCHGLIWLGHGCGGITWLDSGYHDLEWLGLGCRGPTGCFMWLAVAQCPGCLGVHSMAPEPVDP